MPVCKECGGTVLEYDTAAGNGVCVNCGSVVEENAIVSEITFGETSSGGAMVQGSFVGQGATHAKMSGPYGNRGNSDSRAQTIENASKKIHMIASVLRLSDMVSNTALRMYTLAVEHKFTKGRKSLNVVAVCLYIACRQKDTHTHMLIDFSDLLQVNVFELGHTYLQLVQTLNLKLPLVDPSHYISRFAALLEFGDETPKVSMDAVRLVQRFDRDWMTKGRRPAGICGAALLLAARMNNFRRSVEEIVQVVKIADTTLRKRLEEFKNTPSGALTLADFRSVWLDEEVDPPAYTRNKEREEAERLAAEEAAADAAEFAATGIVKEKDTSKGKGKGKKKKGKKRKREDDDAADAEGMNQDGNSDPTRQPLDPAILNDGILAGISDPLFLPEPPEDPNANIDPALLFESFLAPSPATAPVLLPVDPLASSTAPARSPTSPMPVDVSLPLIETSLSEALTEEVSTFLQNPQGSLLSSALDEAHERRLAQITVVDELLGLNEEELDRFILTEEEVKVKERVWVELNKDYLEALAAKGNPEPTKPKKRRKHETSAPRDTSNPAGSTAAESVRNLLNKSTKYSKRINYDALRHLLVDGPNLDEKDDDELYTFDDKSDGEGAGMVLIEEAPGAVVSAPSPKPKPKKVASLAERAPATGDGDADGDDDGDVEEGSDKGEDVGWEDAYEQEV